MPTPKQDKTKPLSFGEQLKQYSEQRAQDIENNANADVQAIQDLAEKQNAIDASIIKQQQGINDTYKDSVETANNSYFDTLKKAYEARMEEYETDTKNDDEQYRKDANRAQWIGLTEVVANIANAIGVANGASNQTIKTVSKDWMQKADQEHKERKKRLEQARENLSAREDAMNKVKLEGILQAAGIDRENAQAILGLERQAAKNYTSAEGKAAEARSKGRNDAATVRYQGQVQAATADKQDADQEREEAQRQSQWAAKLRMNGYNADGSINEEYMADAQRAAAMTSGSSSSSSSSGSGSSKGFNLTFSEGNGLPTITYRIQSDSLENTIAANIDKLSGDDKTAAKQIRILAQAKSGEALSQALLPYVKGNKAMRELIKMSAESYSEGEAPEPEEAPAEQAAELTEREQRQAARQQRREEKKAKKAAEEAGIEGTGLGSTYN